MALSSFYSWLRITNTVRVETSCLSGIADFLPLSSSHKSDDRFILLYMTYPAGLSASREHLLRWVRWPPDCRPCVWGWATRRAAGCWRTGAPGWTWCPTGCLHPSFSPTSAAARCTLNDTTFIMARRKNKMCNSCKRTAIKTNADDVCYICCKFLWI